MRLHWPEVRIDWSTCLLGIAWSETRPEFYLYLGPLDILVTLHTKGEQTDDQVFEVHEPKG